ncbi:hybrid sensor histidine kinase/response regulator [Agitococcus lubricus]|uniref:histidine kinase n=1 Tax=Agitococcus lubricus TaxID=1077255 RepID=A0A2T5IWP0_9GAMM|nr:hybrid sensor histidine kinase/response regulator [Agitococcus lubricus]PTQ88366.1 response regulator receiver domain-containing protein [Agitococcus lubricus]
MKLKLFNHHSYQLSFCREMLTIGIEQTRPYLSLVLAVLAIAFGQYPLLNQQTMTLWVIAAILVMLLGLGFKTYFSAQRIQQLDLVGLRRAEYGGFAYSAVVGLLWGNSSVLLLPQQLDHNLIITMIYLGVCAGASSIAIFGLAHLLVGSIFALTFFVARFPVVYPDFYGQLIFLFLIFHAVILRMAWERNKIIVANLLLNIEKEQLLAQQALEVANAKQANLEKSAFLAAASHDLRQPVHALMLLGHALKLRLPTGENAELIQRMLEAGQALADQFNNLMDLSRLEGGVYQLNSSTVPLAEFVYRLLSAQQQSAQQQGIQLKIHISKLLLNKAVMIDSGLLTRILDNLLGNAIKFSSARHKVLVTFKYQHGQLNIRVYDQAMGIPIEQQQHIFKPYIQLHNPTRDRAKGIGLGLSIVQEAVQLLGGRVILTSTLDKGSCFSVSLPVSLVEIPPKIVSHKMDLRVIGKSLEGKVLLLVEDDPMSAQALMTWAKDWGLNVYHYTDPRQVKPELRPDLILSDIRLPSEWDGIQWLSEWLDWWPNSRGVLVSGELLAETHQRAEQEGLLLLSKPVAPDLLVQTLAGLVR